MTCQRNRIKIITLKKTRQTNSPKSQDSVVHEAWYDQQVSSQSEAQEEQPQSCTHHSSESTVQSLHTCKIILRGQIIQNPS